MPKVERAKPERIIPSVGDFVRVREDAPCYTRFRGCRGEVVQVVGHRTRLRINGQVKNILGDHLTRVRINGQIVELLTDYLERDGAQ